MWIDGCLGIPGFALLLTWIDTITNKEKKQLQCLSVIFGISAFLGGFWATAY